MNFTLLYAGAIRAGVTPVRWGMITLTRKNKVLWLQRIFWYQLYYHQALTRRKEMSRKWNEGDTAACRNEVVHP